MIATLISNTILLGLLATPFTAPAGSGETLVAALHDEDPDIRALAAGLLAEETTPPGATDALTERLEDPSEDWRVRAAAAAALARQDRELIAVTGRIVGVVLDPATDWRVRAAALAASRDRDGGLVLARALAKSPQDVRISNGRTSVSLIQPLADSTIFDALADPDARMRLLARNALDAGIEIAAESESGPCFGTLLQEMLGQASSATGTLALY